MSTLAMVLFSAAILLLWSLAVYGYFENKEAWNKGICEKNGQPWQIEEFGDEIWLVAGIERWNVRGMMIPGDLHRAIKRKKKTESAFNLRG